MAIRGMTTFLWFDDQAEDAARFYVDLFDGELGEIVPYVEGSHRPVGSTMLAQFTLFGQQMTALNGGPVFEHSPAVSFQVTCDTQTEIDRVWNALIADGGEESMCGWCVDRFGVSWQVVPRRIGEYMAHPSVVELSMTMHKFDLATLDAALAAATAESP